jgi:hypothetical protein
MFQAAFYDIHCSKNKHYWALCNNPLSQFLAQFGEVKLLLFLMFVGLCIIIRFKYINQQDVTVSQVYYLTFMCGLTCFGRFLAQHQELTTALAASGFTVGVWR